MNESDMSLEQEYKEDLELLATRAFHQKFGHLDSDVPSHLTKRKWHERADFLQEELNELRQAIYDQNLPLIFDALLDLVFVAKGTAAMAGLPWRNGMDDVTRANLTKVPGRTHRNNVSDVTKPPGWVGPRSLEILEAHGYDREAWATNDEIDEAKCLDDPETLS